jgi:hypothetical protein
MNATRKGGRVSIPFVLGLFVWCGTAPPASAQGATRELPGEYGPGVTLSVSIAIDPPPNPVNAGVEDAPPVGWSVSSISNGGTWDAQSEKVKWGLFWEGSIPATVTYDVTPPTTITAQPCFEGTVFFGSTGVTPIAGDECITVVVPTISQWGFVAMILLVLAAGTIVLKGRPSARG